MVVQCDECSTKFRLDDSKVTENGVKVRCSRCRHVFVVRKEQPAEEPDLDSLLSGLGDTQEAAAAPSAPVAEAPVQPAAAPPAGDVAAADAGAFSFTDEASAAPAGGASAPFGEEFSFGDKAPSTAGEPESPEFGQEVAFGVETAPVAPSGVPGGFGEEFSFDEEGAPAVSPPAEPEPFGDEFSFDEGPAAAHEEGETSFTGEFDFNEAPSIAAGGEAGAADAGPAVFRAEGMEFSFDAAEKAPAVEAASSSGSPDDFSFGDVAAAADEPAPAATGDEGEPAVPEEPVAPVSASSTDGFTSFELDGEEAAAPAPAAAQVAPEFELDFGGEEQEFVPPQPAKPEPAENEEEEAFFFNPEVGAVDEASAEEAPASAGAEAEEFTFHLEEPQEKALEEYPAAAAETEPEIRVPLVAEEEMPPLVVPEVAFSAEGEPPPPRVRRHGGSLFPIAMTGVAVVIVLGIIGGGAYFFTNGPQALDRLGLSFLSGWLGMETKEEGVITVRNVNGAFISNKDVGELFVVRGEVVNNFRKPRASIQVKVCVYGKGGQEIAKKTVYCGNSLTNDQLEKLPMTEIEKEMNNQFGDSLSNLGVKPGKEIPFVAVFANVPREAADYGAESVGSTVGTQ